MILRPAAGTPNALRGLRILVVEDEMTIAMLLEDMLVELGCVVVGPVARLSQAVHLAMEESIDGALLDLNVAGAEVYAAADKLAARDIPFAFVTGYGTGHLKEPYRQRPSLQKPFRRHQLERVLVGLTTGSS